MSSPDAYEGSTSPFKYVDASLLTPAECEALTAEPAHGIEQAPMRSYETTEDFRQGQNNFYMTFTAPPGSIASEIYRSNLAFQRFQVLHPELCASIDERLQGRIYPQFTDEEWELLHQGYSLISQLVDVNDPHVIRNGEVDAWNLCR